MDLPTAKELILSPKNVDLIQKSLILQFYQKTGEKISRQKGIQPFIYDLLEKENNSLEWEHGITHAIHEFNDIFVNSIIKGMINEWELRKLEKNNNYNNFFKMENTRQAQLNLIDSDRFEKPKSNINFIEYSTSSKKGFNRGKFNTFF